MKKLLAISLSLAMALSVVGGLAITSSAADDNYLVLGDASTPDKIGTWTDGSTDIEINEGLIGMKTVTAGDVSISAGVENVDASSREYFEFYVDISEISPDAPFAIVFRMRNADGSKEYMSPSVGAGDAMQLIDA
ncbi:MAG: hypothetical protein IJY82_02640, partial [Oscillospiraceae bacterium]|nr:hypothetical protein [Oscillospiraceae bacterium]